jgi:hypothetical protein
MQSSHADVSARPPCREFEHNGNAAAARLLMQQGLRMCQGSTLLWAEYLNMVRRGGQTTRLCA